MNIQEFSEILKILLQVANMTIIGYGLYKFLNRPHSTLEAKHDALEKRVDEHDLKFKEVEESLHRGNDKFREQKDINTIFIQCMLCFIDFERGYCAHTGYDETEDLDEAKETLQKFLASK